MDAPLILQRYAHVLQRLEQACAAVGRSRSEVRLIAVSKFHEAADIVACVNAGQLDFGENYVQEALRKREEVHAQVGSHAPCAQLRWHMIGHVQSRKAAQVAGAFSLVHTLDSRRLADALERHTADLHGQQPVLFEVNIAEEEQKNGVFPGALPELADYVLEHCPHLDVRGLMCLPPVFDAGQAARPHFAKLRQLRDDLRRRCGLPLPELSMGMSGDFEEAVAEGATMVRIGTEIFGPRFPKGAKPEA